MFRCELLPLEHFELNKKNLTSILFIFYLLIFCYIITRISFFTNSGLNKTTLILLFCIKVFAGLLYAWYYLLPANYSGSDTYRFFNASLAETDVLLKNPVLFFKELFTHHYTNSGNIFIANQSYWNDLKSNIIIKLLAVINVFTIKNYYAAIVFFNFLFFFGLVGFYRLIQAIITTNKWMLIIVIFLMPSFLFWSSGVHKDGLIFSALGIIFWQFYLGLKSHFSIKKIVLITILMGLIFGLRNFIFFILLLNLLALYLSNGSNKPKLIFVSSYSVGIILFFSTSIFSPKINLPNYVVIKHQEFTQLEGRSSFNTKELQPSVKSFIEYLPTAVDIAFLRPHFNESKNKSYLLACFENIIVVIVILFGLVFRKKNVQIPNIFWACWLFALSILLIEGYTITFSGAIVRYKSLAIPFIIAPIAALFDVYKLLKCIKQPIHYKK